jgi:MFS superfamily sulfate permease-like transporter
MKMENEKITLLVASILAILIFLAQYKFNKFGSKIPNPLFSVLLILLLISLIVLPVYARSFHKNLEN